MFSVGDWLLDNWGFGVVLLGLVCRLGLILRWWCIGTLSFDGIKMSAGNTRFGVDVIVATTASHALIIGVHKWLIGWAGLSILQICHFVEISYFIERGISVSPMLASCKVALLHCSWCSFCSSYILL